MKDTWNNQMDTHQIIRFITQMCEGRPSSHGVDHMKAVRERALEIHRALPPQQQPSAFDVSLVSLLHDVADHKYDYDGSLMKQVKQFLITHSFQPEPVIACINAVSFSKERARGKRWFAQELGPYWTQVRDIVSDADKLEALGEVGGKRCLEYAHEHGLLGHDAVKHLIQQIQDKLLHLRDHYIVTEPAKQMAGPLHDQLVEYVLATVQQIL
jgi:HD superfamily phosphodiesterase